MIPGQQLLSGFAVSPALSARAMLMHYGRTHLAHGINAMLDGEVHDPLAVPVTSAGRLQDEPLSACRRSHSSGGCAVARPAVNVALAALILSTSLLPILIARPGSITAARRSRLAPYEPMRASSVWRCDQLRCTVVP